MNDRCAAGTGKFLEFMATSFQLPIEEFGNFALQGKPGLVINSMCTVFAETEATSLMARGHKPEDIALALHVSVVKRSLSMLRRVSTNGALVFSGGVARNRCVVKLIERGIISSLVPAQLQIGRDGSRAAWVTELINQSVNLSALPDVI